MAAAAFATTTAGFSLAGFGVALGETAWFVVAVGIVHRIAPPERRGLYHGIWATAMPVAWIVSPLLASFSLEYGGPHGRGHHGGRRCTRCRAVPPAGASSAGASPPLCPTNWKGKEPHVGEHSLVEVYGG